MKEKKIVLDKEEMEDISSRLYEMEVLLNMYSDFVFIPVKGRNVLYSLYGLMSDLCRDFTVAIDNAEEE